MKINDTQHKVSTHRLEHTRMNKKIQSHLAISDAKDPVDFVRDSKLSEISNSSEEQNILERNEG